MRAAVATMSSTPRSSQAPPRHLYTRRVSTGAAPFSASEEPHVPAIGRTPASSPAATTGEIHVWCSADQAELIAAVRDDLAPLALRVCGVDGTQTATLASALGVAGLDDPRELGRAAGGDGGAGRSAWSSESAGSLAPRAPVVWLAADADLPSVALRGARARPIVLTAAPAASPELPWDLLEMPCSLRAVLAGMEFEAQLAEIGTIHSVHLEVHASPLLGGLGMAMFDAVDAICALLDPIEAVSASVAGPDGRPVRTSGLRRLSGRACAHLRDHQGRGATLVVGDRCGASRGDGRWTSHRASIVGEQGELLLDASELRRFDRLGREIERGSAHHPAAGHASARLAAALRRIGGAEVGVAPPPPLRSSEDVALRLAVCDGIRLSAITGAVESVSSMLAAVSAPGSTRGE